MARAAAAACGASEKQALVLSTGIIGAFLPMDKILPGIQRRRRDSGARTKTRCWPPRAAS